MSGEIDPRNGGDNSDHDARLGDDAPDAWTDDGDGPAGSPDIDSQSDDPDDPDYADDLDYADDPEAPDVFEDDPEARDDADDRYAFEDEPPLAVNDVGDEWVVDETEWGEEQPYEDPGRRRMVPAFLVGALAGMLVLGLVWVTTSLVTGGDGGGGGGNDAEASAAGVVDKGGPQGQDAGTTPGPTRLERCRQSAAELAAPVQAASPAMDQWEIHVGAMNKLVVGAISQQQANAFWNSTRVGAQRKLDLFYRATRKLRSEGLTCPTPDRLRHASSRLRSCAERVSRDVQVLNAAMAAMGTWNKHVKDMEMLRMGHLSPSAASQMWLMSWHAGVRELNAYRAAVRSADTAGRC